MGKVRHREVRMAPQNTLVATDVAWMGTWAYRVYHAQSQQEANSLEEMMLRKFCPHSVLDRQGLSSESLSTAKSNMPPSS